MNYKVLLFDADNTLFDFDKAQAKALEKTLLELHGSFETEYLRIYEEINHGFWLAFEKGEIAQETIKEGRFRVLADKLELALSASEMSLVYAKYLGQGHYLLEGAQTLIESLHATHKLAIVTNGLKEIQRPRYNASSLKTYFEGMIVSDELGVSKPNTEIFDAAFELLGQPDKKDVLMIGDSLSSDMQGGINYGIDTCWFNPNTKLNMSGLALTHEIKKLEQLHAII